MYHKILYALHDVTDACGIGDVDIIRVNRPELAPGLGLVCRNQSTRPMPAT